MRPLLLSVTLLGCVPPLPAPDLRPPTPLNPGETRQVVLRALRMNVKGFQQQVTLRDLRALPEQVLRDVWLLDLPLQAFVENSLRFLAQMPDSEAALEPQPVQNMRRLLNLTPDNANLSGTKLEDLVGLSSAIGQPAPRSLARIMQVGVTDRVVPLPIAAKVLLDDLISSHPFGQRRSGPVTTEHPDGRYAVTRGAIPVTLADVVDNFAGLAARFGPTELPDGRTHPGFMEQATGFSVIEDAFAMRVRVNANALPYKGVDLTDGSVANVNSAGSQIDHLFATERPDWLEIDGLVERPTLASVTVRITEEPTFLPGGDARAPLPRGNSPVWALPPWRFERIIAHMVEVASARLVPACTVFTVAGGAVEVFKSCVDDTGWVTFETFDEQGHPPPPAYMWDLQLELAQVRLHDGGLAEGAADVQLTIRDIEIGVTATELVDRIRENLRANPRVLREFAATVADTTDGAADFYYVRDAPGPEGVDYLYFIHAQDIPRVAGGGHERSADYPTPGFFEDEALTRKLSDTRAVEAAGDTVHEKLAVRPGAILYVADNDGGVYRLEVGEKPSLNKLALSITRLR